MKQLQKILVLTHPLGSNYGGILQAYALQKILKDIGFETITTDYSQLGFQYKVKVLFKILAMPLIHTFIPSVSNLPLNSVEYVSINTKRFVSENMATVDRTMLKDKDFLQQYDSFVVGSDQVWRSSYVPVTKYLLDFTKDLDIKRISYAASFGQDDLSEYSTSLIKKSSKLAQKFDAISVRENSGIDICKKHWGVDAIQHIDPTLLLEEHDYNSLVEADIGNTVPSKGTLFSYTLDRTGWKGEVIDEVAKKTGLIPFEILPPTTKSKNEFFANVEKYQLQPVTQWLRSFKDAKFIVTDSFHGCAFSIIFNKPFIAIGNKSRGLARFTSLLKTFDLEDRLLLEPSDLTDKLIKSNIDWRIVNKIKAKEKDRSMQYLYQYLGAPDK